MDDIEHIIKRMEEFMDLITNELYSIEKKELRPLTHIIETDDEVIVNIDLPCITKSDLSIKSTEDTLTIRANLNKMLLDTHFECYNKTIKLPTRVDPKNSKAYFKNGVLQIRLKKKIEGNEIAVE